MKNWNQQLRLILLACGILVLAGCGGNDETQTASADADEPSPVPILAVEPEGAESVKAAMQYIGDGGQLALYGRVGGVLEPVTEGYAVFILADEELVFCDEMGEDHCATPWDACCEDPEKVQSARILVQFSDEQGLPVAFDLATVGIQPNSKVTLTGSWGPVSEGGIPVFEAAAVYSGYPTGT